MIVIIKNNTQDIISIKDLSGATVPVSGQINLTDIFKFYEIASSLNLKTYVTSGDVTVNDGTEDLSIANGLKHLEIKSAYEAIIQNQEINGGTIVSANAPSNTNVIWINSNNYIPFIYDSYREKWLSITRSKFIFTFNGTAQNAIYLAVGDVKNARLGVPVPRIGTIVSICAICDYNVSDQNAIFDVRCTSENITYTSFQMSQYYYRNTSLNIDTCDNSKLAVQVQDGYKAKDPVIQICLAWRAS